ncbi:MAG: SDR family oxidoreductase [Flavobacteriales bacterium]|nr:SDR family oxidoreductase [Flavobacteriales bacterium]
MLEYVNGSVLVTGAGSGIGLAVVHALLAESPVHVIGIARNADARLAEESRRYGLTRLQAVDVDLESPDVVERVVEAVGPRRLLALVHNAARLVRTPMGAHDRITISGLFDLNVTVPLLLSQALTERLDGEPPGHIVHIGSMGGFQDSIKFPGLVSYSATKAALACTAQCLAEEFRGRGIRSNCLALGAADTEMLRAAFPEYKAQLSAQAMGAYIARFALDGHKLFNGKVLPVSATTP